MSPELKAAINVAARAAAETAVKRTMITMGVDITTVRGVKDTQQDMAFLRRLRLVTDSRNAKLIVIVFSTVMAILGAGATTIVQQWLGK
jgi:hypothetical protein